MNNQSLDSIVYGNDALNADERLETIISSLEEDYPVEPSTEPVEIDEEDDDDDEDLLRQ